MLLMMPLREISCINFDHSNRYIAQYLVNVLRFKCKNKHVKLQNSVIKDSVRNEPGQLTANQRFRHSDLVTVFVTVILSISEGLGKMALGIVKYAYDRSSQLIGVIWFVVSCRGPVGN